MDEVRYDSTKPWTYKSKEERGEEKRQGNYWCHKTKYKQDFKQGANNQHPIVKSHQDSQDGRNAKQGSADAHIKQEKKDEGKPSGETNTNLSDNGAYKDFMANRRCYYCGKRGHLAKDCYKKRNVNVARVPSLAQVSGEALTVSGSIGEVEVPQMLRDSGATISVISEDLVPAGVTLSKEVWVGTVGVEPKPYPTVLVPATVNGKQLELFAAVVPADRMTCPVILGRYIPGKKVSWTMKVEDENGTVFKLDQTVKEEEKTQPTKKPSRRKNKFRLATAEPTISTTVEREKTTVTFAEEATCRGISSGEPTSQVVEEKQLKSPSEIDGIDGLWHLVYGSYTTKKSGCPHYL